MKPYYSKSPIAKYADSVLKDKHLFSSDSDSDYQKSLEPRKSKKINKVSDVTPSKTKRNEKSGKSKSRRSRSISKAATKRSEDINKSNNNNISSKINNRDTSPSHLHENDNSSCYKQKYILKTKINDLERILLKQEKKMKNLVKKVDNEKQEISHLTDKLRNSHKKDLKIEDLQNRVQNLQENELHLMKELAEQQKLSKEALNKLANIQEDSMNEIDRIKKYYRDFYNKQNEEEQHQYESKYKRLESENEKLVNDLRTLETEKNLEKTKDSISLSNEILLLNNQLSQKNLDIDKLKTEVKQLKSTIRENERSALLELKSLRNSLETLNEENHLLKTSENQFSRRDINEKLTQKRKIDELEIIISQKDNIIKEKDYAYKAQLEKINEKVYTLQGELSKMVESEQRADEITRDLQQRNDEIFELKKYYKEKIHKKKITLEEQKKEWSMIYNELLSEIKYLKNEIDNLGDENKKLLTTINGKSGAYYRDY